MKPYQAIPIRETHEPLLPLPLDRFAAVDPHPYQALGAPYGQRSPFWVRASVLERLEAAQTRLDAERPGWRIQIFDALRPVAVQQFMVDRAITELAVERGLDPHHLSPGERDRIVADVQVFWAIPSFDPATPPPHSTGGAIDITLVNAQGEPVDMGSPIDELSPRSYPDHFANCVHNAADAAGQTFHQHRQLLRQVLNQVGMAQHPNEWWHFCYGDQTWAWLTGAPVAHYGRVPEAV